MWLTGNTLVEMAEKTKQKSKMTLELEMETLAELKAAVVIFGAKSYSSLIHQQVVQKIREAKNLVSKEEFEKIRDEQILEITNRSKIKSLERKNSTKLKKQAAKVTARPDETEKISVNARSKNKTGEILSTRDGEVPLVDESSSATGDEEQ